MNYRLFYKADEAVYYSISYKSIVSYEIETAGTLDLDSELKIYISGQAEPLKKEFNGFPKEVSHPQGM